MINNTITEFAVSDDPETRDLFKEDNGLRVVVGVCPASWLNELNFTILYKSNAELKEKLQRLADWVVVG